MQSTRKKTNPSSNQQFWGKTNRQMVLLPTLLLVMSAGWAQPLQRPLNPDDPGTYNSKFLRRSSLQITLGSGWIGTGHEKPLGIDIAEIGYAWSFTRAWDVGISAYGSTLCNKVYLNESGLQNLSPDDPEGVRCDRKWRPASTILLTSRYYPVRDYPAFGQIGVGYALDGEAPVWSVSAGYSYRFFERIAVVGLIRYMAPISLSNTPEWLHQPGGLRLELGFLWHHRS
jgi:hypothetical protein